MEWWIWYGFQVKSNLPKSNHEAQSNQNHQSLSHTTTWWLSGGWLERVTVRKIVLERATEDQSNYSVGCVYSLFDIYIVDIYLDYGYMNVNYKFVSRQNIKWSMSIYPMIRMQN